MFKKHKIKKISFSLVVMLTFSFCFSIISVPIFANDENINKTVGDQVDGNSSCNTEYLKLLEAVKIKADVASEKENAYNKAINEFKLYVSFFGTLLIIIVIYLGIWRNNKIVDAKDEIMKDIENKKENLGEENAIKIEKKMLDLERYRNEKIDEIKEETQNNIKDIQDRLGAIENNEKNINEPSEDTEDIVDVFENKNENPYD